MLRKLFLQRSCPIAIRGLPRRGLPARGRLASFEALESRRLLSTWYVNSANSTGTVNGLTAASGYPTIQAAINVASPGDTVRVETGKGYSEADTVDGSLTIEADAGQKPVDQSSTAGVGTGFIIPSSVTGVTISGLTIKNFGVGIEVASSSATIVGNSISGNSTFGIHVVGGATIGGTSAGAGNSLSGNGYDGIFVDSSADATILGNSITDNGDNPNGASDYDDGIDVFGEATIGGTSAGAGNTISSANDDGIFLNDYASATILGNSIADNGWGGIELNGEATIGGTSSGAGNVISGNTSVGIAVDQAASAIISGNSTVNDVIGIEDDGEATIGGTSRGAGNDVSGNRGDGIVVGEGALATILDSSIGTNGVGIVVSGIATIRGTSAGAGDTVSGNSGDGVEVDSAASATILGSSITKNAVGIAVSGSATIGSTSAGAGDTVSGNSGDGVEVDSAARATILGSSITKNAVGLAVSGIAKIGGTSAGAGDTVSGNGGDGIEVNAAASATILGSSITGNGVGIVDSGVAAIGMSTKNAGNTIAGNSHEGILVQTGGSATITDDSITRDSTGILVGSSATDTCRVTARDDDLSGNTTAGLTNNETGKAYAVVAQADWWGSLHGPTATANPGGNGTRASSGVTVSPWIGVASNSATTGFDPTGITLYAVPTRLVFVREPSPRATAGVVLPSGPIVEAEDASGYLGINFDSATVGSARADLTLEPITGTGKLTGGMLVSPSGGLASFNGLIISKEGTYKLSVKSAGFGALELSGTSNQIDVSVAITIKPSAAAVDGGGDTETFLGWIPTGSDKGS